MGWNVTIIDSKKKNPVSTLWIAILWRPYLYKVLHEQKCAYPLNLKSQSADLLWWRVLFCRHCMNSYIQTGKGTDHPCSLQSYEALLVWWNVRYMCTWAVFMKQEVRFSFQMLRNSNNWQLKLFYFNKLWLITIPNLPLRLECCWSKMEVIVTFLIRYTNVVVRIGALWMQERMQTPV